MINISPKLIVNLYELFSFKQLVEPTRVTLETATIVDHIATTCARNIVESGVHKVSLSDHFMVYCIRIFDGAVKKDHEQPELPQFLKKGTKFISVTIALFQFYLSSHGSSKDL